MRFLVLAALLTGCGLPPPNTVLGRHYRLQATADCPELARPGESHAACIERHAAARYEAWINTPPPESVYVVRVR